MLCSECREQLFFLCLLSEWFYFCSPRQETKSSSAVPRHMSSAHGGLRRSSPPQVKVRPSQKLGLSLLADRRQLLVGTISNFVADCWWGTGGGGGEGMTCAQCHSALQKYASKEGRNYCITCYGQLFCDPCSICGKRLTGKFMSNHWQKICNEHMKLPKCCACCRLVSSGSQLRFCLAYTQPKWYLTG